MECSARVDLKSDLYNDIHQVLSFIDYTIPDNKKVRPLYTVSAKGLGVSSYSSSSWLIITYA